MSGIDRRQFIHGAAATAAVGALALQNGATGAAAAQANSEKSAPSERVQVGCIGVGGRAGFLLSAFAEQKDVDIVAIADLDKRRIPAALEVVKKSNGRTPEVTGDFRHLVDNPKIDALVVGTPDHWHAIPTIMACIAGKDVYVEKPDGHNIIEGQRMVAALRKHKRIVQMGTQSRTSKHFQTAMEYIRSGKLGKVLVAKSWESTRQGSIGRPSDTDPPKEIDYDTWLGPAPKRQYNPVRFHGNWRWFFDYGTGDLGNDGVHRLDVVRWALATAAAAQGEELPPFPTKISALGGHWFFDDMQEWPDTLQVNFEYGGTNGKPGRILTYEMRVWVPYDEYAEAEGVALYGNEGYIIIGNHRWRAFGPRHKLAAQDSGNNDGVSHIRNFLECIKTRNKPNADLETVGHPSSVMCHAGNIAWRVGRQLTFDPTTESFVGDNEANVLRTRPEYRKPWLLPEV